MVNDTNWSKKRQNIPLCDPKLSCLRAHMSNLHGPFHLAVKANLSWQTRGHLFYWSVPLLCMSWGYKSAPKLGEKVCCLLRGIFVFICCYLRCNLHFWLFVCQMKCAKKAPLQRNLLLPSEITECTCLTGRCVSALLPKSSYWSMSRPPDVLVPWRFIFKCSSGCLH